MADGLFVITGASTGIGRATAIAAAAAGFHVVAGVRRVADADALRQAAPSVETVLLDVRDADAIARLQARVDREPGGLAVLVNNAGALYAGMVEVVPLADWRQQYEINVFGVIAVTQALLPALRKARGRVINVSSIGGRTVAPAIAAYQSSKYALEAVSDALRMETRRQGVRVVIIEPGAIRTPIWDKTMAQAAAQVDAMTPAHRALYGERTLKLVEGAKKLEKLAIPPARAARVLLRAATVRRPRVRYLIGVDARVLAAMKWTLPDRVFDWAMCKMMGD